MPQDTTDLAAGSIPVSPTADWSSDTPEQQEYETDNGQDSADRSENAESGQPTDHEQDYAEN